MKKYLSIILILISCTEAFSQETPLLPSKPKVPLRERLFISPDLGLQFGTVTAVNISPKIGYRITPLFAAGIGVTYLYINDKRYKSYGLQYESNTYGGSIFAQYQILEAIRAYAEYEVLNLETFNIYTLELERKNVPSLLVGGGYSQPIGANSSVVLMLLINLFDGPDSIYENPIIRIGFNLGL